MKEYVNNLLCILMFRVLDRMGKFRGSIDTQLTGQALVQQQK
jgi:hypothetical protein